MRLTVQRLLIVGVSGYFFLPEDKHAIARLSTELFASVSCTLATGRAAPLPLLVPATSY